MHYVHALSRTPRRTSASSSRSPRRTAPDGSAAGNHGCPGSQLPGLPAPTGRANLPARDLPARGGWHPPGPRRRFFLNGKRSLTARASAAAQPSAKPAPHPRRIFSLGRVNLPIPMRVTTSQDLRRCAFCARKSAASESSRPRLRTCPADGADF